MELSFGKWACAFRLSCWLITSTVHSAEGLLEDSKVRGVNLGGWLGIEGWIKPSLFDGIANGDMLVIETEKCRTTRVQLKSVTLQKYVSAENGGAMDVTSSWETFRKIFNFLYKHGINTVRIPVGWWIAFDPDPPAPFIGGSLEALDNAFSWAESFDIKCIIDLHPVLVPKMGWNIVQAEMGSTGLPTFQDYISHSLHVIKFLISKTASLKTPPRLLSFELMRA
ncbi:hypothetical protein L6164_012417 [Bauhinia variegata]|uniref:Uncharacterized protein n=1 Tax=Bauhinia variegata TaxID=167791 RepID=A0ACB9P947_BAUVA|nr:hypothetical protein L6164_012417 [Bauhinia variegata]